MRRAWRRAHALWRMPGLAGLSRRLGGCARLTCLESGGGGTPRGEGAPPRWMRWGAGPGSGWARARARGDRSWAAPSRRGSPGFPVMGLWGACPDSLGGKGHGRARSPPTRAWEGSASCSGRPCRPHSLRPSWGRPAWWVSEGLSLRSRAALARGKHANGDLLFVAALALLSRSQHPNRDCSPGRPVCKVCGLGGESALCVLFFPPYSRIRPGRCAVPSPNTILLLVVFPKPSSPGSLLSKKKILAAE